MYIKQPISAVTENSVLVIFEYIKNAVYDVYVDGKIYIETELSHCTIEGLQPDTVYIVSVTEKSTGNTADVKVKTAVAGESMDVRDFGAVGDGKTNDTLAIQAAIDNCPINGKVILKNGTFLSGAITLKSNMTLEIAAGAKLLGSPCTSDYPVSVYRFEGIEQECYASLINTDPAKGRLENIRITGNGIIDANGEKLFSAQMKEKLGKRGRAICISKTDGVYIKDVTVRQSPAWCVHTIYSNNVVLNNVKIFTKFDEEGRRYKGIYNGDGFDPDSCRNVTVIGCVIGSQDDCIAIKSGKDREGREIGIACEDILIRNCRFISGFGVAIGSEMSGCVRNVTVENCTFENTYSIASIKAPRGRGGMVENVLYRACTHYYNENEFTDCKWFRAAIYIDRFYGIDEFDPDVYKTFDEETGIFRNIVFEDIESKTAAGRAVYIVGLAESKIKGVTMRRLKASGSSGMVIKNAEDIVLEDIDIWDML